jgi:hypothetical protein
MQSAFPFAYRGADMSVVTDDLLKSYACRIIAVEWRVIGDYGDGEGRVADVAQVVSRFMTS